MSRILKQSQTAEPLIFLMVDSTDHITGKTGLTCTVTLSKNGAAFGAPAGAVTEIANGWYKVAGNATDTGTLGPLILHASATGADPTDVLYQVVGYDPESATVVVGTNNDKTGYTVSTVGDKTGYSLSTAPPTAAAIRTEMDSNSTKLAHLDVDVSTRNATTPPTVAAIRAEMDSNSTKLAHLDADVSTRLATSGYTTPPTVIAIRTEMDTNSTKLAHLDADITTRLADADYTDPDNASIATILTRTDVATSTRLATVGYTAPDNAGIAAIQERTDNLPDDPASNTEVDTRLADADYTAPPTAATISDAVWDEALAGHATGGSAGSALSTASSGGVDPAILAQAVWDEATGDATTAGSLGKLINDNLNATVSSRMATFTYTAPDNAGIAAIQERTDNLPDDPASNTEVDTRLADVDYTAPDNTSIGTILTRTDVATSTRLATTGYTAPDNAGIAAVQAVTDALPTFPADPASETTVNTRLADADYTDAPTASEVADAVWDEALAGHVVSGSAGNALATASSGGVDPAILAQAVWDEATGDAGTAGSIGKLINDNLNATVSSRLATSGYTAPDNASITTILARADVATSTRASATDYTPTRAAKLDNLDATVSSRNATTPPTVAAIRAEIDANSTKLDAAVSSRLADADYTVPPTVEEIDTQLTSSHGAGTWQQGNTTTPPTVAAIRAELDTNSTKLAHLDADVSTRMATFTYTAPDNASITAIKAKTDNLPVDPTSAAVVAAEIAAVGTPDAEEFADAIWDATSSSHDTVGTFGHQLNSVGASADPLQNPVPGGYAPGQAGYILGRLSNAAITVQSQVAANGGIRIYASYDQVITLTDSTNSWPDFEEDDVLTLVTNLSGQGDVPFEAVGTVSPLTGTGKVATFNLTFTQTDGLVAKTGKYDLQQTIASTGRKIVIAKGGTAIAVPKPG